MAGGRAGRAGARRRRHRAALLDGAAAVRPRDDLEVVAVRIVEVEPAASVVAVDLARPRVHRIGPVFETALADPREDLVELVFADEERVVLDRQLLVGI